MKKSYPLVALLLANIAWSQESTTNPEDSEAVTLQAVTSETSYIKTSSNIKYYQESNLGVLGEVENINVPLSVSSYNISEVKNYNNLPDILRRDPSVRRTDPSLGISEGLYIRGFRMGFGGPSEYAFDGIYGITPNQKMLTQGIERVDVVKGPGSTLFGVSPLGATGGAINVTPKRATGEDFTEVFGKFTQKNKVGGGFDVSKRILDSRVGIRANLSYEDGEAFVKGYKGSTLLGALSLDYTSENTETTLDYIHQAERIDGMHRSFSLARGMTSVPKAPAGNISLAMPWMYSNTISNMGLLKSKFYFNEDFSIGGYIGGGETTLDRVTQNSAAVINQAGDARLMAGHLMYDVKQRSYGINANYRFTVGVIDNDVHAQLSRYEDERIIKGFGFSRTPLNTNIYRPNRDYRRPAFTYRASFPSVDENTLTSLALSNTLSNRDKNIFVNVGSRLQKIETKNAKKPKNSYSENAFIPFVGVTYKPRDNWSLYANYTQGLSFGESVGAANRGGQMYANAFESLKPFESKQLEIGAKAEFGNITANLALFQITRESAEDSRIDGKLYRTLTAEQKNRGIELNAFGAITNGIRIGAGLAYINSEITRSKGNPVTVGKEAIGTPKVKATVGIDVDVPLIKGLTWGNDLTYVGKQYYDGANTLSLKAFAVWDMNFRYKTKIRQDEELEFSLNFANVTNNKYFDGVTHSIINQGEPRNIRATLAYRF